MGRIKTILNICIILVATSCNGIFGNTDSIGKPIQFGTTLSSSTPKTRTSYSGKVDGNTERIYWSEGDQVSIYMDWNDGSGYSGNPEYAKYSVHPGSDFHPGDGYQRYGRISPVSSDQVLKWHGDFSGGDGHAHEYPHTFYSAYPPTNLINGKFTFDLPSTNQNGNMKYAYMAAYEKDVKSNTIGDGHVELHYYPMITTFCLTIHNDLNEPIETITLKSDRGDYLAGNYSVSVNDGMFGFNDYEGNNSIQVIRTVNIGSGETVKNILFFIIPQGFNANELYFLLNSDETKRYIIDKPINAYYKYNINITVSEKEPDIEEPGPLPPLSAFVNGVIYAEAHKRAAQNGQWEYGWYLDEDGDFAYNGQKVPEEKIWEIINSLVDLDVTGTWEMGNTLTPDDLNFFPNLKTVKVSGYFDYVEIDNPQITEIDIRTSNSGTCVFNIHDCDELEKLNIHEGKSVTVKGNGNLTELNVDSQNISDFELDDCDVLTTFVVDASPNGNCVKNVKVSNNESLIDFYIKQPTTNDNFYLLAENNDSLTHFEIQQIDWQGNPDWNAWGLTYRFDIQNCDSFIDYKVSNNAKTW